MFLAAFSRLPPSNARALARLRSIGSLCYYIDCLCRREAEWIMGRDEIYPGTLDLLILKTLGRESPMHGFEIARAIQQRSGDVLQVEEGSLYPALQRMLVKGWVKGEWGLTDENRRARYYRLTAAGKRQLESEVSQFERVIGAMKKVLEKA